MGEIWEEIQARLRQDPSFCAWEDEHALLDPEPRIRCLKPLFSSTPVATTTNVRAFLDREEWVARLLEGCAMWTTYRGDKVLAVLDYRRVYPLPEGVLDLYEGDPRIVLLTSPRSHGARAPHCLMFEHADEVAAFLAFSLSRSSDAWTWA